MEVKIDAYCRNVERSQEGWRQNTDYSGDRRCSGQTIPSDCLGEITQEEKEKIFNNVYSCIDMFYRIANEPVGN
jgi:hypothetical protein